jgi:hypothetical protein
LCLRIKAPLLLRSIATVSADVLSLNPPVACLWAVCDATRDPERGWDHNRVKGVVAKLVRVKDPAVATALEVAAGGRLYQVGMVPKQGCTRQVVPPSAQALIRIISIQTVC